MKATLFESRLAKVLILIFFGILLTAMLPETVFAASTTTLLQQKGSGAGRANGDYISALNTGGTPGLNTY